MAVIAELFDDEDHDITETSLTEISQLQREKLNSGKKQKGRFKRKEQLVDPVAVEVFMPLFVKRRTRLLEKAKIKSLRQT